MKFTPPIEQAAIVSRGRTFQGWESVEVSASLEAISRSFSFSAAVRYPGARHLLRIRPGSPVEVKIGADVVITGWVDKLETRYGADSHTISVSGRSRTCDLVDCAAPSTPGHWRGAEPLAIARELAAEVGVDVVSAADLGGKVSRFAVQKGELVEAALQRLAELRSFIVTDDASGRLVLTRAGSSRAESSIAVGENVLEGGASIDLSGRFNAYQCKGARAADDRDFGSVLQVSGAAADSEDFGRRRTYTITAGPGEDAARCAQRAAWEAATRYGQSIELSYTVQGWRQREGGPLWAPNLVVEVRDPLSAVEGDFLIVDCRFRLSSSGTTTELSLRPIEGFEALPPAAPRRRGGVKASPVKSPFASLADGVTVPK